MCTWNCGDVVGHIIVREELRTTGDTNRRPWTRIKVVTP